jgi:CRP/FNR family transcriptional regulator
MDVTICNVLRNSNLFVDFSAGDVNQVARISSIRGVSAGQPIFFEGDRASGFFIVAEGMVKVYQLSASGKEHTLRVFGKGEAFAEAAAFNGGVYPANAAALTKGQVLYIPMREFGRIVMARPQIAMKVISSLSMLLHNLVAKMSELALGDAPTRLAKYLLSRARTMSSGSEMELPTTKSALATELNVKLETLSRLFARFKKSGIIGINKNKIVLLDPNRLKLVAEGDMRI